MVDVEAAMRSAPGLTTTMAGVNGTFDVADDEPAAARDWMPVFAAAVGGRRPLRAPVAIARLVAPPAIVHLSTNSRAASNRRLRDTLGWSPRYPSWRQGFAEALRP